MGIKNLFKKKNKDTAADSTQEERIFTAPSGMGGQSSGIVKGVMEAQSEKTSEEKDLLNIVPEVDDSLLDDLEAPKSIFLTVIKICFVVLLVFGTLMVLFFKYHIDNSFTFLKNDKPIPRLFTQVEQMNATLLERQTSVNTYQYLQVKGYMDYLTYYGDQYLHNYKIFKAPTSSERERNNASRVMTEMRGYLRENFMMVKDLYLRDATVPILNGVMPMSDEELTTKFNENLRTSLSSQEGDSSSPRTNHLLRLIGNKNLRTLLVKTDFDALNDDDLAKFVGELNDAVTNSLSTMQQIKMSRIRWTEIMKEIELRTIAVDNFYTSSEYEKYGGVRYNNYSFDNVSRRVSISGETKILDSKLFSFITDLIISINSSPYFSDGEMKSFSKSGDLNNGYSSGIRLTLTLEDPNSSEENTNN